jgi:hypothetical protein
MNVSETATLLGKIQVGDNREVSDVVVAEWHDTINYLRFDDAVEAVRLHRRSSTEYLSPAHVVAGAKAIARQRAAQGLPEASVGSAPRPFNEAALMEAHRSKDSARIAAERARYNRQCVDAGFAPVPEWGLA